MEQKTCVYKTVQDCEIKLDLFWEKSSELLPVLMWIHAGALIMGHRGNIKKDQLFWYLSAGYAVVSIDYRLSPETKLPEIIADLRDAYTWIRNIGPTIAPLDSRRIGVIGHSGGGYLALMSGHACVPPPQAVVSFYGYGDIIGKWYTAPDPFYCQQPLVKKADALKVVGTKILSETPDVNNRFLFYLWCRQNGRWAHEVMGLDPVKDAQAFKYYCPLRNVTRVYPPTMLLHGTADTDVPYEQSYIMALKLEDHSVNYKLSTIEQGGHGFDGKGIFDETVSKCFTDVVEFLDHFVKNA
jgi:acetyl esterase/lipase